VGLLFACHGAEKLFGVLGGRIAIHSPLRLAAPRLVFPLSVVTTFYSQPSTLSVAIADLVSR
jgi:hypothetical protein